VDSPCVRKCKIEDGACTGCLRTLEQVISWTEYSDEEREVIMKDLKGE